MSPLSQTRWPAITEQKRVATLGDDSEAELEALLASGEDSSAYGGLSPGTAVPSDLLELPPLELVVPDEPTDTTPLSVTKHINDGVLPQLLVEVVEAEGAAVGRKVDSLEPAKRTLQRRPWLTNTQPPLLDDDSMPSPADKMFLTQLEDEMQIAAVRHRRHVYRASLESDRMRESKATIKDSRQ